MASRETTTILNEESTSSENYFSAGEFDVNLKLFNPADASSPQTLSDSEIQQARETVHQRIDQGSGFRPYTGNNGAKAGGGSNQTPRTSFYNLHF